MGRYTTLVVIFACLGSWCWGYTAGIIAATLGNPAFIKYFGLDTRSNANALIGAINGLFSAGGFIGCYASVIFNDKLGRRKAIFVGGLITALGSALQGGSVAIPMYLAARIISGLGVGFLLVLIPQYQSELAPADHRGLLVGLHGVSLCIGYFCSVWFGYAFYLTTSGPASWRVPLLLPCAPALLLCLGILFLVESPRWLVAQGRVEEASKTLHTLHDTDRPDLARDELFQIRQQLEIDSKLPSSWISIIREPHYRKRAIIGFLTTFFVQCTGNLVLNNYTPLIYKSLGFDTNKQLLLTGAWITLCPFGNMFNAYLMDKIGRKPLLITGLLGCVSALVGEMVCVARWGGTDSVAGNRAAVFFLFYHMMFFCSCCDATSYVYLNEIWPNHVRSKGSAVGVSGLFAATIIYLSSAPSAFATIGWKFYLTLAIPAFFGAFTILKVWPETKGIPLEEIGEMFGDPVAVHLNDLPRLPGVVQDVKAEDSHIEKVSAEKYV